MRQSPPTELREDQGQKAGAGQGEIQRRRNVKLLTGAELKIELITETTILIKMTVLSHSQWEKCHTWNKA